MSDGHGVESSYDRIAHLYDIDMARNMAFDDAAFYARVVRAVHGPVLELGCGNGRILLALLAEGVDILGVDRSQPMLQSLQEKASACGLAPKVYRMDVRALGLRAETFAAVLCPYSLVTYMSAEGDPARLLAEIRRVLRPGGTLAIDAFVPRASTYSDDFRIDYSRSFAAGTLTRAKRVQPLVPGVNRIERRYEIEPADGTQRQRIETVEDIRPFTPDALSELVAAAGFVDAQPTWDYASPIPLADPQFFALVARAPSSRSPL